MGANNLYGANTTSWNYLRSCLRWNIVILMILLQPCCGTTSNPAAYEHTFITTGRATNAGRSSTLQTTKNESAVIDNETMENKRSLQTSEKEAGKDKDVLGGSEDCPCIDATNILSTRSDCVTAAGLPGVSQVRGCFPLDYGTTCEAHDMTTDSNCVASGSSNNSSSAIPSYCYDQWCFVDYDSCKMSDDFFYRSNFDNIDLFWSYSTCGSKGDAWIDYEAQTALEGLTLLVTVPTIWFPDQFKYAEDGTVAADSSYYYDDSIPWTGVFIDYLNAVVALSNIAGVNYTSRSVSADKAHPQSSYTASVHDVSARISDLGGAPFWITSQRLSMATFSTPFAMDRVHLFIRQPGQKTWTMQENAQKILMPFAPTLWVLLIFVVLVTALLVVWFDRTEGDRGIWNKATSGPNWERSSTVSKIGILLKSSLDSFLIQSASMLGHATEFDPTMSLTQKIIFFGFAVVIFISVAAYTANLVAFLTLSGTVNYVSNMEEAIATNTRVCAHPTLEDDYAGAWPGAVFVYNKTAPTWGIGELMGMLHNYDAGECDAVAYQLENYVLSSHEFMEEFCKRGLVSTGSHVLEKQLAVPVRSEYAAGLSYWFYEAEKKSVRYQYFQEQRLPSQLCNLRLTEVPPDVNELLSLNPASMILPTIVWISCIVIAIVVYTVSLLKENRIDGMGQMQHFDDSNYAPETSPNLDSIESPRLTYLSRKSVRHRMRNMDIAKNNENQSDNHAYHLLHQQQEEIMRRLSEITSKSYKLKEDKKNGGISSDKKSE